MRAKRIYIYTERERVLNNFFKYKRVRSERRVHHVMYISRTRFSFFITCPSLFHFPSTLLPFKPKLLIRLGARARGYIQNSFWKGEEVNPPPPHPIPIFHSIINRVLHHVTSTCFYTKPTFFHYHCHLEYNTA